MPIRKHIYLWAFALLCFSLASCARPVLVVQTSTADLALELDAYVQVYPDMQIAYDFWSPDGVPFISFYNATKDTLLLDLNQSNLLQEGDARSQSLENAILAQTDYGSYTEVYPDLVFKRINRKLHLVLEPQVWASIYGPSCYSPRGIRRGEGLTFTYVYSGDEKSESISHDFDVAALTRISRKEISTYERTEAGPDQFFIDKHTDVDMNTTNMIIDILVSILFAI